MGEGTNSTAATQYPRQAEEPPITIGTTIQGHPSLEDQINSLEKTNMLALFILHEEFTNLTKVK